MLLLQHNIKTTVANFYVFVNNLVDLLNPTNFVIFSGGNEEGGRNKTETTGTVHLQQVSPSIPPTDKSLVQFEIVGHTRKAWAFQLYNDSINIL